MLKPMHISWYGTG